MSTFAIEVQAVFAATHQLRLPDGTIEPLHGHDWHVTVTVASRKLDDLETVMDFHILERHLNSILEPWQNQHLNTIAPFDRAINPSAERVAERIAGMLAPKIALPARLVEVRVTEAPGCVAIWRAD